MVVAVIPRPGVEKCPVFKRLESATRLTHGSSIVSRRPWSKKKIF